MFCKYQDWLNGNDLADDFVSYPTKDEYSITGYVVEHLGTYWGSPYDNPVPNQELRIAMIDTPAEEMQYLSCRSVYELDRQIKTREIGRIRVGNDPVQYRRDLDSAMKLIGMYDHPQKWISGIEIARRRGLPSIEEQTDLEKYARLGLPLGIAKLVKMPEDEGKLFRSLYIIQGEWYARNLGGMTVGDWLTTSGLSEKLGWDNMPGELYMCTLSDVLNETIRERPVYSAPLADLELLGSLGLKKPILDYVCENTGLNLCPGTKARISRAWDKSIEEEHRLEDKTRMEESLEEESPDMPDLDEEEW